MKTETVEYMKTGDAARMLGIATQTLVRWDKSGKFKCDHRSMGNQRKYLRSRIVDLLESGKV